MTDGPFVESKEYLAGFWIIEATDLDVALKLAAAGSKACNRKVEVRPFHADELRLTQEETIRMTRYMIAFDDGDMTFPEEDLPDVARAAQAVVQAAREAGVWVFGAGLEHHDVVSVVATDGTVTDGPYPESKEHIGGFAIVNVPSHAEALRWAARIAVACRCAQQVFEAPARSRHVELQTRRNVIDVDEAITRAHQEEWARLVAALARRFGDLDIAEEAAAAAFATAVERWPTDGVPPNPGAWLTTTANRRAIDRIRREHQARRQATGGTDVVRRGVRAARRARRHRRRPASADLHLLSPGARDGQPRGADVAPGRRSDDARDRPCVPRAGDGHAPAGHPGEGQDQGDPHPLSRAVRGGPPGPRLRRPRGPVPRLQRGLPGHRPRYRSRASGPDRRGDPAHATDPCPVPDDGEVAGLLA